MWFGKVRGGGGCVATESLQNQKNSMDLYCLGKWVGGGAGGTRIIANDLTSFCLCMLLEVWKGGCVLH